ncbi:MAG TPA: IS481 family transposase [Bryobacteraceae bacterium]
MSEQRLKFVIRADSGLEEMKALCVEFGISRPTGYTWLKRFRDCERLQDLGERSRRPHHSPLQTAREVEGRVIDLRKNHPDWGAAKLVKVLARENLVIPRITAHRILLRNGLVRDEDRPQPATKRFEREAPNQLWQMDFKGMPVSEKGCLPLVILDDHSRYLTGLFATASTRAEPVQQCLTAVFRRDGLPDAILFDHGTPWWNMLSPSGWTWLTVWLMKQGIRLYVSGLRHPQTQGKIERCNRSLESAMRKRPRPAHVGWQEWLDAYREEHNHVRPHEALGMDVPAQHWKPSSRPFVAEQKPWEYADPANVRKVRENGGVSLNGHSYFVGRALIGEDVQLQFSADTVLVYFCRTLVRQFDLRTGQSAHIDYGQFDHARSHGL